MTKQRAQAVAAVVLFGILAVLAWRNLGPESRHGGRRGGRAPARVTLPAVTAEDVPVVSWLHVAEMADEEYERDRNLFNYAKSPAQIAAERREAEQERIRREQEAARRHAREEERLRREAQQAELERQRAAAQAASEAEQAVEPREPATPPKPDPPTFPYRYVGIIGPRDDSYAILQDEEEGFSYARAGEVVNGSFMVERVGRLNLDLSFTDEIFAGEIRQVPRLFPESESQERTPARGRRERRNRSRS